MRSADRLGGIIHTYQKYDPKDFPSPTRPPPDMVSGAFEHMLAYGSLRELTDEEPSPNRSAISNSGNKGNYKRPVRGSFPHISM